MTLSPHAGLLSPPPSLIVLVLAFLSALLVAAVPAHAVMMEVDPQTPCVIDGDNVQSILQAHDATVLRIVLPDFPSPNALRCVARAKAEGYRVYISLQYQNAWSPARVASYFAETLPQYAPYVWAVSVGNEQDLGGRRGGRSSRREWRRARRGSAPAQGAAGAAGATKGRTTGWCGTRSNR